MDYERIHKVQIGVISPSKLRMKLLGTQHIKRKEGGSSSRASPSKLEDAEYANRNLLAEDLDEEAGSTGSTGSTIASINTKSSRTEISTKELSGNDEGNRTPSSTGDSLLKGNSDKKHARNQNNIRTSHQIPLGNNFFTVQQQEEDGNDYDSGHENASTSSFEFHRGEKVAQHIVIGPFSRHIPSKWNDAEKWLVNRQVVQANGLKKSSVQYQCNRLVNSSWARIAPESVNTEQKPCVSQSAASNPNSQNMTDKFSFDSHGLHSSSVSSNDVSGLTDPSQATGDSFSLCRHSKELNHKESSVSETCLSETSDISAKPSVSMRDVGTEMTPIPSQEPSRTGTPIENLTPSRSPISSISSSPRRRSVIVDMGHSGHRNEKDGQKDGKKVELSERELQLKTRREIAALGLQLGKLNIASWASKEAEQNPPSSKIIDEGAQLRKEYEARAEAWEEAEKSKHMSRYKREEIKIQAWECHQRAKYEARMRKVEIRAVNMRSRAEVAMAEKLRRTEQRVEEKRANAEAKRNWQAAKTSQQAEGIRLSGRAPSHVRCCSWFL